VEARGQTSGTTGGTEIDAEADVNVSDTDTSGAATAEDIAGAASAEDTVGKAEPVGTSRPRASRRTKGATR
jgi:hypothetical protein